MLALYRPKTFVSVSTFAPARFRVPPGWLRAVWLFYLVIRTRERILICIPSRLVHMYTPSIVLLYTASDSECDYLFCHQRNSSPLFLSTWYMRPLNRNEFPTRFYLNGKIMGSLSFHSILLLLSLEDYFFYPTKKKVSRIFCYFLNCSRPHFTTRRVAWTIHPWSKELPSVSRTKRWSASVNKRLAGLFPRCILHIRK
jgi:hypothetical protein